MNFEIIEIDELSGNQAVIYSVIPEGERSTLYDEFLAEYSVTHKEEVQDIVMRLFNMGQKTGAREQYFKLKEGKPGDLVCALYDRPGSHLRLYCIRLGMNVVILGGGGPKSNVIRAWQEDEKLSKEVHQIMKIAKMLFDKMQSGDIKWSYDGARLEGDLNIENHDN